MKSSGNAPVHGLAVRGYRVCSVRAKADRALAVTKGISNFAVRSYRMRSIRGVNVVITKKSGLGTNNGVSMGCTHGKIIEQGGMCQYSRRISGSF